MTFRGLRSDRPCLRLTLDDREACLEPLSFGVRRLAPGKQFAYLVLSQGPRRASPALEVSTELLIAFQLLGQAYVLLSIRRQRSRLPRFRSRNLHTGTTSDPDPHVMLHTRQHSPALVRDLFPASSIGAPACTSSSPSATGRSITPPPSCPNRAGDATERDRAAWRQWDGR